MSVEKAMASSTCLKLASPLQSRLANPAKCSLSGSHHLAANRKSLQGKLLSTTSPKVMVNSSSTRRSCSIRSQTVATPPTQTKQVHMQNKVLGLLEQNCLALTALSTTELLTVLRCELW